MNNNFIQPQSTIDQGTLPEKTILVVNTGSIKKRFILQKIKKLGLTTVVLNKEKNWAQPYVDHWILADNTNHNEALRAAQTFISSHPDVKIDGVITFWEDDVLLTAKIVDKFNLIGIPYEVARRVRNKFLFRDFCSAHRIPAPRFSAIKNKDDLKDICQHFQFPLVLKPAFGSSGAFVVKVAKQDDLLNTYQYVRSNISENVESALTDGLDIFVEEYIDGDEVDIDLLLQNGKIKFYSLADNYNKDKGMFFVDSGQAIPSSLPIKSQWELLEMAEEILEKLGIYHGCIHVEAKYSSKGAYPIEINLRLGGDYVYSYTKSAWGVDLIENAVKICVGDYIKVEKPAVPKTYIVGWDLHPNESGILAELDVKEEIKKEKFVNEVQIYKKIGEPIFLPPEGFDHLGWLTVSGENLLDARDNLTRALKFIDYKVVKFDPESFLGKTERKDRFSPAVWKRNLLVRTAKIEAVKAMDIKDQRSLRIGLLVNLYQRPADPIEERLTLSAEKLKEVLISRGYNIIVLGLDNFSELVERLKKERIDLIFNLGERLYNESKYKSHIASLVDSFQIPYTGSDPLTLSLASDKIRFKKLLAYQEIPTPAFDYLYDLNEEIDEELEYPLIIKPAATDHAIGISNDSVVTSHEQLRTRLKQSIKEIGLPVVIEEYIDGDEYEVYILGNDKYNLRVLPLVRSMFDNFPRGHWRIQTFVSKWLPDKFPYRLLRQSPPKNISKRLYSLITEIALDTYTIFGCQDYSKVDIKVDKDNNPYVIDLNPNPWLDDQEGHGIISAAKLANIEYGDLAEEIIHLAIARYQKKFQRRKK